MKRWRGQVIGVLGASVLAAVPGLPSAFGQCLEWLPVATDTAPPSWNMRLVYDAARHRAVALGSFRDDPRVHLFEFAGRSWIDRSPSFRPAGGRFSFGACFHAARGTVVLYGGYVGLFNGTPRNDLWEWDGARWSEVRHSGPWPEPSGRADLAYDPGRQRVILLSRRDPSFGTPRYETWEWTGTSWERGPNLEPTSEEHRSVSFAFDEFRGRGLVNTQSENGIFAVQDEVWEYSPGATAQQGAWRKTSRYPSSIPSDHFGLDGAELVYDPFRRQMLRHGGRDVLASPSTIYWPTTDFWDPAEGVWKPFPGLVVPSEIRRIGHGLCFDRDLGEVILYGGSRQDARPNQAPLLTEYRDTWRWVRGEPGLVVDLPASASWCGGQKGILAVTVAGSADLQWYHDGAPIPGATSAILVVDVRSEAEAGRYQLIASNHCGEIASRVCRVGVTLPPVVTRQPVSPEAVCPGETMTFEGPWYDGSISELELQRLDVEWRPVSAEFQFIAGRSFFSARDAKPSDSGSYRFRVRNACATVYSRGFHVQVGTGIQKQPVDVVSPPCEAVVFTVAASGVGPLRYQWRRDGVAISASPAVEGTTTPSFRIKSAVYADEGHYDVIVSDACRPNLMATSRVARLTLAPGPQWVRRSTRGPSRRFGHAMAYDSKRERTLLFGGHDFVTGTARIATFNDLWDWDGDRWKLLEPRSLTRGWFNDPSRGWRPTYQDRPVQRADHNLVYDASRDRLVLFGGQASTPDGGQYFLDDLWEWDGANWHFRSTNGPRARIDGAMAYDPTRKVSVLMGGFTAGPNPSSASDPAPGTVWEWNGVSWKAIVPADGPSIRHSQVAGAMAYADFGENRRGTVYGPVIGSNRNWEFMLWDGTAWKSLPSTAASSMVANRLAASYYVDVVFDPDRSRLVAFGGLFPSAPDPPPTAFYSARPLLDWSLLDADPQYPVPPARSRSAMAYDVARQAIVLFGGDLSGTSGGHTNDTWELRTIDLPVIVEQPVARFVQTGEAAEIRAQAAGRGPLNYQWLREGIPLSDGPRVDGSTTSLLRIARPGELDSGTYQVRVGNACGVTTSRPAWLALGSQLKLFGGDQRGSVQWTRPGGILEHAPSPLGPWTPIPDATSPFELATVDDAGFFRLRFPP